MKQTYLDYAAATPVLPAVLAAMQPYYAEKFYNPSALYGASRQVKQDLDTARAQVAAVLGARPTEVIFTAGGTEANNLAIRGVMEQFPDTHLLTSAIEHESILLPSKRYEHTEISVTPDGVVDLKDLEKNIQDNTVLISVMYANNEVGSIQPIRQVVEVAEKVRAKRKNTENPMPLYVHTDACQAGNYLDLHVSRLGVDMMTINGGKIYGPKQSGVLFVASHVRLIPQILGGGQERNMRSGTENIAQSVGLATALHLAQANRKDAAYTMQALQHAFIDRLTQAFPAAIINGSQKRRLPNNVHCTLPGQDNERLIFALDEAGIQAAAGSACNASNEEPSHVLRAMGIAEEDAQASLRFTMGQATTVEDIERTVQTLTNIV